MSEYIYRSNAEPLVNECGEISLARAGEIVRCRDCVDFERWDYPDGSTRHVCGHFEFMDIEPDGFCAWAERREP